MGVIRLPSAGLPPSRLQLDRAQRRPGRFSVWAASHFTRRYCGNHGCFLFAPLSNMLKSSGSSCLISGRVRLVGLCWLGARARSNRRARALAFVAFARGTAPSRSRERRTRGPSIGASARLPAPGGCVDPSRRNPRTRRRICRADAYHTTRGKEPRPQRAAQRTRGGCGIGARCLYAGDIETLEPRRGDCESSASRPTTGGRMRPARGLCGARARMCARSAHAVRSSRRAVSPGSPRRARAQWRTRSGRREWGTGRH